MDKSRPEQVIIDLYLDMAAKALTASIYDESSWEIIDANKRGARSSKKGPWFTRGLPGSLLMKALRKKSTVLVRQNPHDREAREEGKGWPLLGFTMVGHRRLENIRACVEDVLKNNVPGDLMETGAWRGGATIFMRALLKAYGVTDRKVWVADSFEGLPIPSNNADGWDLSRVEYLKVSLEEVKSNFEKFGLLDDQVKFLKGWFCDTLPDAPVEKLAVLRLDGDMYSSTMDCLENLFHKVSKGGYIIVDDYYSWPSCRQAVSDFLDSRALKPEIRPVDWTGAYWKCE
jgi:O-methyltransferase